MADALQTVRDMAAECKRGQTPSLLEQFLRETFGRQANETSRFGQLLRKTFGMGGGLSEPRTFEVNQIVPFEDGEFFRRTCVFTVWVRDHLLEGAILPCGGTFGLFSLSQKGLRYLNRRQDNVEELLREEGRALNECAPTVLASFVAEALGRECNSSHDVLASPEYLAKYPSDFAHDYELDAQEWARVQTRIAAPMLTGDGGTGWQLEFCTVFGWMHEKQTLIRHRYGFAPDFRIVHEKEVLSRRIFKRTPQILY